MYSEVEVVAMIELKPCPFCGGKAILYKHACTKSEYAAFVCCDECREMIREQYGGSYEAAAMKAAKSWNRRTDNYKNCGAKAVE